MEMPRTTHALPQTQRAHLIRSTRKVGELLGETPLLVDSHPHGHHHSSSVSSTSSTESKRSARIFAGTELAPRSSSLTAVEPAPEATSPAPARPLLYLHLAQPTSRPLSTALATPLSPAFPPTPPPVDRRRKMAKLARTLGPNVPPELVFSAPARTHIPSPVHVPAMLAALAPAHSQRRGSYGSVASPTLEAVRSVSAMSRRSDGSGSSDGWIDVAPTPYSRSRSHPRSPNARSASCPPSPCSPRSPHYVKASSSRNVSPTDDRSMSSHADAHLISSDPNSEPDARPSTTSRSTADTRFLSRRYEFAPEDDDNTRNTHRREQGWSGEWSGAGARGMDDVVSRLRDCA
ncbi:hypothetical protein C8R44DRAFT_251985 [Mycena epipterygia]|nr:hypothetical protein C8R44DRAFT_251985 [Mycena epipterygia]